MKDTVRYRLLRLVCCSAGLFVLAVALRAQIDWTAIPSGSSRNLWSVCHGGGQFVAVGEGGTILTSPDGLAWTSRSSGTDVWLTAVAFGLGNYVAVGESGTVLASHDAITWSRVSSDGSTVPTTERLNVVGFIPEFQNFIAYGERSAAEQISLQRRIVWKWNGDDRTPRTWWRAFARGLDHHMVIGGESGLVVFATSVYFPGEPLAIRIDPRVRNVTGVVFDRGAFTAVGAAGAIVTSADAVTWTLQDSGTNANLNALAAFNRTLVAVGDHGTIVSQDARNAWQQRPSPTSELLLGIAASDPAAVIVGGNGTILRATPTLMPPSILESPAPVVETRGGAASFRVRANGSAPLTYQWFRDGISLAGETRDTLTRAPLTESDAGVYLVRVANSAGSATTSPATLSQLPPPPPVVDESFRADPSIDGTPTALLPLPDGSVLVANGRPNELVKLRPDGSSDSAWARNTFALSTDDNATNFDTLVRQADGRILVGGNFSRHNDATRANLVRLNADGTLDSTFAAGAEATVRSVSALALASDGKILVANGGTTPVRLLPDGRIDPAFRPEPLPPAPTSIAGTFRDYLVWSVDSTRDGKVLVAMRANTGISSVQRGLADSIVFRLDASGARDTSFAEVRWTGTLGGLRATDDGGAIVLPRIVRASTFPTYTAFVWRFSSTGVSHPGHTSPTIPDSSHHFIYPDGRVLFSTVTNPVRVTGLGTIDSGFTGGIGSPRALTATADGHVLVAGSFTLYNGKIVNRVVRLNEVANGSVNPPRIVNIAADKTTVAIGETVTVRAAVIGSGDLTYEWRGAGSLYPFEPVRTNSPEYRFAFASIDGPRSLRLTVYNPSGQATSTPIDFVLLPNSPVVLSQPGRVSAPTGRDVILEVQIDPKAGQLEYHWFQDGRDVSQAQWWLNGPRLYLPRVSAADAGVFTLTVRNVIGATVTSAPIRLTLDDTSRFANLSTRAFVGPGEQTLVAGVTLAGPSTRSILIRGIGPGLTKFGVGGVLPDPQLAVYTDKGALISAQVADDWNANGGAASVFARVGAFPLDAGSKDAVLMETESPGSYTVQLPAKPGQSGNALIEIYEADNAADRILNLSTRALVGGAAGPAIAGFSIVGSVAKRVLIRVVGPALAAFGVGNPLADPRLELRNDASAVIAANDDWTGAAVATATGAVGAFPLGNGSRDAALLVDLAPGNYTAIAEGKSDTSGVILIEVYEVP